MHDQFVWIRAQEFIKKELDSEQLFGLWFSPIRFVSVAQDILTLEVPSKFFKDWLLERYAALIETGVRRSSGRELKIVYVVSDVPTETAPAHKSDERSDGKKEARAFWPFGQKQPPGEKEVGLVGRYTFDDFVVGSSNKFSHAACLAVSETPAKAYNPLFIYGASGLGKTHLMHAIGHRVLQKFPKVRVLYISSEEFTNQLIAAITNKTTLKFRERYRNVDLLLIDDIHFIAGKDSTQEEFFHTFNALYDAHKQIVVSSDRPPKEIQKLEERLVSRFAWGLVTDVQPPDFETRVAILKKKSEKETIALSEEVFFFLAEKVKTNIRELEGALMRVVAYAKLMNKDVAVDFVKDVLKDMIVEGEKKISIDLIQRKVSEYFDIKLSDMRAKSRSKAIAYPRQVAMYLARKLTDASLPEIGNQFGGRDHTTVMHACDKIDHDVQEKEGFKKLVESLTQSITG